MAQPGPYGMMSNMSALGGIQRVMELMRGTTDRSMEYGQDFGQPERMASYQAPYQAPNLSQQDFTQVVPIAGAQNVGVQRGNPLQTLLSIIQRRRQGLQGRQGQQGLLQSGFTGRV